MNLDYIELTLPIPISINTAYAGKDIRHKSVKYKRWIKTALEKLANDGFRTYDNIYGEKFTISGDKWLKVEYTYYMPIYNKNKTKKIIDVFNYEKVLSDFLGEDKKKKEAIITGFYDHLIQTGTVTKINSDKNIVKIRISELDEITES